jgi:P53 DNA-binding domain
MEVGRRTVDLKVCSCPGRDMGTEEKKETNEPPKEKKGRKRHEPYPVKRSRVGFRFESINTFLNNAFHPFTGQ